MEENDLAAILAAKRSAGVTPEVNLREHVTHMIPPSVNKAAHSGFETQRDVTRSPKQGYQWLCKKDFYPPKFKKKRGTSPVTIINTSCSGGEKRIGFCLTTPF